jgi:hypothetical protein
MGRPVPTNVIVEMNRRGFSDFDIVRYLRGKGYTPVEINDAMNHAKVKMELSKTSIEEEPEMRLIKEEVQEEVKKESITEEQFKEFVQILNSKLKVIEERNKMQEKALEEIKEQIPKIIHQQTSSVKNLNADVQALQQTFSKILEPLAHNVKVMSGILDMPKEEKSTENIEKEIKKVEVQEGIVAKNVVKRQPGFLYFVDKEGNVKKTKAKGKRRAKKIIKTVTVTETKAEKPKKEKKEKTKTVKTTVTKTEIKTKKKTEPGLEDIF